VKQTLLPAGTKLGCQVGRTAQQLDEPDKRPVRFGSNSVVWARTRTGKISREFVREFCVNQSCTVLHRPAFRRNERPANLLMQLQFQIWKCNAFRASPADCRWPGDRPTIGLREIGSIDDPSVRGARRGSSRWRPRRPRRCRVGRTRAAAIGSPMGRRRAPPHQSELKRRPAVSPSIPGNVEFARTSVASGAVASHTTSTGKRVAAIPLQ